MNISSNMHSNKEESQGFLRGALIWRGSVTPRILPTLMLTTFYSLLIVTLNQYWRPLPILDVTPFEYTGVVLGLVLVFRTNAGHERWWEARKIWGGIVNDSRNLVIEALSYGDQEGLWKKEIVKWTIAYSFATRESLRNTKNFDSLTDLLSEHELEELKSAAHMPLFVAGKIALFGSFPSSRLGMRPWKLLLPESRQAGACQAGFPTWGLGTSTRVRNRISCVVEAAYFLPPPQRFEMLQWIGIRGAAVYTFATTRNSSS